MAFNIPPANDLTIVHISNELRSGNLARILLDCDYHLVEIYLALREEDGELINELQFEIDGKESSIDLLSLDRVNLAVRKILRFAGNGCKNVFIEQAEILLVEGE